MGIKMLLTNKFNNGEIISIKLISGEEIVAKLGEETDTTYEFQRPVSLSVGPQGAALTPYMMTANVDNLIIVVDKNKVIAVAEAQKEVCAEYTKATTGLIAASAGKIIQ
jgi:hypothetical protein